MFERFNFIAFVVTVIMYVGFPAEDADASGGVDNNEQFCRTAMADLAIV